MINCMRHYILIKFAFNNNNIVIFLAIIELIRESEYNYSHIINNTEMQKMFRDYEYIFN